jgi:signal transduction histidine kinase
VSLRLGIFTKFFLAFCGLAIIPLLITTALIVSDYQQMAHQLQLKAVETSGAEMAVHTAEHVAHVTRDTFLLMAFILLISVILVFFVALYVSRSFSEPITALLQVTRHLGRGDFSVRLESTRQDEFGALAAGFNRMADQLETAQRQLAEANAELEDRVTQRTAELEMANLQLRATATRIVEAVRLKGEFLANLSHELLTPLHAVLGYSELALEGLYGPLGGRQTAAMQKLRDNAQTLRRLINDIVDLLKAEAGRMALAIEPFDARELIDSTMEMLRHLFVAKKLHLTREVAADLPHLETDRGKVQHILYNLLSNALKFTREGNVTVRAYATPGGEKFVCEVEDTGPGIAPDKIPTIFQAYRQLDGSTTRPAGGAGIGLTLTKELVDLLGGEITVHSRLGRGSLFRVTLPASLSLQSARPADETGVAANGAKIVLCIDDDEELLELLTALLEPAGYRVIRCTDGETGLLKAQEIHPYAVTLDIKLPSRDGWSVLNELKSDPETADIPVIVLSVANEREKGERFGASAYLTKPFSRDQLIERLASVGRRLH